MSTGVLGRVIFVSLVMIVLSGCARRDDDGQVVREVWNDMLDVVPPQPSAGGFSDEICEGVLARLRRSRAELTDTNAEPLVFEAVDRWVETAQSAFFDCIRGKELVAAYQRLERLHTDVEALLPPG